MKKQTAFIGAILSLIPLGQPLIIKTSVVLSTTGLIFFHAEKTLANSFNVDYDNAIELFDQKKYSEAISKFSKILKKYSNLSKAKESDIYLFLAMSHGYLNKHYAALGFINKAIDLNPTYGVLYLDRATTKNYLGDKKGYCLDLRISMDLGFKGAKEFFDKWGCN